MANTNYYSVGNQPYVSGTITTNNQWVNTSTTINTSGSLIKADDGEGADFRKLIAFKGLRIIEALEKNGCILLKCKRGNKVFIIETNASYAEIFNSKNESIIQIGWKFIKSLFGENEMNGTNPWVTTTNDSGTWSWTSNTAGGTI